MNVVQVNVLTREANVTEVLIVASNQMKQIVVSWHNGSQLDLQFVHKTSIFMPAASSFEFWFASGPNKIAENVPCSIFGSHLY